MSKGGMGVQAIIVVLGVVLTALPNLRDQTGPVATLAHILGPLVISVAVMAMWEVLRAMRWLHLLLGMGMAAGAVLLAPGASLPYALLGLMIAGGAWPRGRITRRYGGGWRVLMTDWRKARRPEAA